MSSSKDRTVIWIVAAVILALVCCLCVVLAATASSVWFTTRSVQLFPTLLPPPFAPPAPTPDVDSSSWSTQEVPPEAGATRDALQAEIVPAADLISLAERLEGKSGIPRVLAETAAPIQLGTVQTFWGFNNDTIENFQVEAELVYATEHVYFWVEQGVDYRLTDVKALVDDFETKTYPTDRAFFGSEWTPGVDGDVHLYILYLDGLGATTAGQYGPSDEYSPLAHEYSNGHEMFYIAASQPLADDYTYGTLAHEFQHMIHWSTDENEDAWMDEGFSMVAEHLNGHDVGGWDFAYADQPDQTMMNWPSGPGEAGSHYGQSFLVLTYLLDRFGEDVTKAIVANSANGLDSIDTTLSAMGVSDPATGLPIGADDFFLDWALALLLQDPSVGDGRYAYTSYSNAPQPAMAETVADCPVADQTRSVSQYGVDYIELVCSGNYNLAVQGAVLVPVLPEAAHSGDYAFWSNRGDGSDMTLTRSFDLTNVSGPAALDYSVWYDLEEGYDYVYLEVSDDGGKTWTILETPSGTGEDPSGNSYGWGYNGLSGGGQQAEWIQERADLSDHAGKQILLRFEYVTDAGVNGEGLLLDDLRLDTIGYTEDFETGDGGWQGDGFVRISNQIPQTFQAALVEYGRAPKVTYLSMDETGKFVVPVSLGGDTKKAVLVITGTARHTWQPAIYRFSLTPNQ